MDLRQLQFTTPWIIEKSDAEEHDNNGINAYIPVKEESVPLNSNFINSHIVFKLKVNEDGDRSLNSRISPHGNRD